MPSPALSILIPARDEHYCDIDLLGHTVQNVLANTSDNVELVIVLDGYSTHWPIAPLPVDPRITVIHHRNAVGQRAATNEAARVARGEYVMKLDAHCAISPGFDTELLREFDPLWTVVPRQFNLHVFDWKCKKCGERSYQSPKPAKCGQCGSRYSKQVVVWHPTDGTGKERGVSKGGWKNVRTDFWRFDTNLEFQYHGGPRTKDDIHDTMSLLGACWAIRKERYWELGGLDEQMGNWGQMGSELAMKTWLSGGRLVTNKRLWFAHFFRTGGIGFPWPGGGHKEQAMARCRELWLENKWPGQKYPLSWLIEKLSPLPDWTDGNPVWEQVKRAGEEFNGRVAVPTVITKPRGGVVYYTCGSHDETLELAARNNLRRSTNGHELGCVALQRTDFGDWTVVLNREKSGTTMHYQIVAGLERSRADYVFLCESDVMYSPSHFEFVPPRNDTIYYNTNVWRIRYSDGHAVRTDGLQQVSGICANRELLLAHYRKRIEWIEANGGVFDVKRMAYEPGTRGKFGDERIANWMSEYPNLDITGHGNTLTVPHFSVDSFRNKKYAEGWQETDDPLPGWPKIAGRLQEWLKELASESLITTVS
jgi:hypothetical protein